MARQKEHPAVAAVRGGSSVKVKVAVSDIDGILRGKYLHRDKFLGATEPHQARANSNKPMPSSAKLSRSRAACAAWSSSGKHNAMLRAATRRRAPAMRINTPPTARPSLRCSGHGRRASNAAMPMPNQAGQ